jgi:1,2-diacylglycerol 3-alpha-glucosyltransferase
LKLNKHILFIIPGFSANENDCNTMPYLQDLLLAIKSKHSEISISIITLEYPFHQQKYDWNGFSVNAIGGNNKKGLHILIKLYKAYQCFKGIHKNKPIDLVHTFWLGSTTLIGNRIRSKFGIPHLANSMGQDVLPSNKYLKLIRKKNINQLIYASDNHHKVSTIEHSNTIIQPFGILSKFTGVVSKSIDILGVGSLIPLKQYHLFIETIDTLVKQGKNINAVLIGDGPEMKFLKELIFKKKLQNSIKLVGKLKREDVFHYMAKSKIFLHPARYEGMGMVYIEALAHNMRIVSFNTGLAKPEDYWQIAKTPEQLPILCANALVDNSKVELPKIYEATVVAEQLVQNYNQLIL